jgi:hypothetical protein
MGYLCPTDCREGDRRFRVWVDSLYSYHARHSRTRWSSNPGLSPGRDANEDLIYLIHLIHPVYLIHLIHPVYLICLISQWWPQDQGAPPRYSRRDY